MEEICRVWPFLIVLSRKKFWSLLAVPGKIGLHCFSPFWVKWCLCCGPTFTRYQIKQTNQEKRRVNVPSCVEKTSYHKSLSHSNRAINTLIPSSSHLHSLAFPVIPGRCNIAFLWFHKALWFPTVKVVSCQQTGSCHWSLTALLSQQWIKPSTISFYSAVPVRRRQLWVSHHWWSMKYCNSWRRNFQGEGDTCKERERRGLGFSLWRFL